MEGRRSAFPHEKRAHSTAPGLLQGSWERPQLFERRDRVLTISRLI